jgi:hypothetical protein
MEHQALLVHHVLEDLFRRLEVVPLPVEDLLADWLLLIVVQSVEVRVAWKDNRNNY